MDYKINLGRKTWDFLHTLAEGIIFYLNLFYIKFKVGIVLCMKIIVMN